MKSIALYNIFGLPLIVYGGLTTLALFVFIALIPFLNQKGIKIPFNWHKRLAYLALIMAAGHGILGISIFI